MSTLSELKEFNKLFNEYNERFIRFALSYVREKHIAEDFVSEAFTTFWENREQLLSNTKPQAYILTIIKNKCLNHLQHVKVRQRAEKELNDHAEWVLSTRINTLQACDPDFIFSNEIEQIIESTLNRLPEKTRRIFLLNRYQGLSYKDIAEQMGLSVKTIEFHISKALSRLRFSLKDYMLFLPLLLYFY
jgi:RNA polymerase sigma-70 factor (ECF subfamily)